MKSSFLFALIAAILLGFTPSAYAQVQATNEVRIMLQDVRAANSPIGSGAVVVSIQCEGKTFNQTSTIGPVQVGNNLSTTSQPFELSCAQFTWQIGLFDGQSRLLLLNGQSDFRSAEYTNPLYVDTSRILISSSGSSVVIIVTAVEGSLQFAAEAKNSTPQTFQLQYWIDSNGDGKREPSEVVSKNLTSAGGMILDNSTLLSLRLVTLFEVRLDANGTNVVLFSGKWDFTTNKIVFSNSTLSPNLDVVKWAWFFPNPKSIGLQIPLDNRELFHAPVSGTATGSLSHGSGILVGLPDQLFKALVNQPGPVNATVLTSTTQSTQPSVTSSETTSSSSVDSQSNPLGISHITLTPFALIGLALVGAIAFTVLAVRVRKYFHRRSEEKGYQPR